MLSRLLPLVWLWLGAALLLSAVVAPAAFAVLPSRALAGALVGRVLPVLFWSGAAVGAVLAFAASGWRRAAALLIVASAAGAELVVAPRIARAREALGPVLEAVPADHPDRVAFGRLHGISVLLLGVAMLGAAAIAVGALVTSRVDHGPPAPPSGAASISRPPPA